MFILFMLVERQDTAPTRTIQYTTPATSQKQQEYIHKDIQLERRMPEHATTSNINNPRVYKRTESHMRELERNRPIAQASVNPGGHRGTDEYEINSREYKLTPKLNYGGFENNGMKRRFEREEVNIPDNNIDAMKVNMGKKVMNQFEGRYESTQQYF